MVQALDQAGVEHILMKGYVLREYYPVPELRTFGDIGIVIHPRDRVHQLMLSMGYGAGARMYMDVAAFVCHFSKKLDWSWVREALKKLELWEFACVVFTAVERWFGVNVPMAYQPASNAVMADFLIYTMEAGVFGHHKREGAMADLKQRDSESVVDRGKLLLKRTFPAAHTIQTRYTYLQKQPWMLPVAWVHRLVKTRDGFGKHAHEAQVILSADAAEISRLHNLMRNIGL